MKRNIGASDLTEWKQKEVSIRSAAIADMRFDFIERMCESTVVKPKESRERIRSQKIDRILTGKYTAIPCFIMIMLAVFYLTFNVIGALLTGYFDSLALTADCDDRPGIKCSKCK